MSLPSVDKEGFLVDLDDWNPAVAEALARQAGLELSPAHWELITLIREFYRDYEVSPAMRVLVKHVREQLGPDKGDSIYLMTLFPGSPAKLLAKVAGLPRPTNCL
jgi:tRNA 2-thiouridine synthesizing protein E